MTSFTLDPGADIASLTDLHRQLSSAILESATPLTIELELASAERPGHLVLQLLASAAKTRPSSGAQIAFGPLASAEKARMDIQEGGRA